jgi:four helix bundle protein
VREDALHRLALGAHGEDVEPALAPRALQYVHLERAPQKDLGNQLRRAASSVALNIAEGSGSHGGTRLARYRTALGSARETEACLDVAVALGYVAALDSRLLQSLGEVQAMLGALVR